MTMGAGRARRWHVVLLLLLIAAAATASDDPALSSVTAPPSTASGANGAFDRMCAWLGLGAPQFVLLPPDEAFRLDVRVRDARTLVATLTPANGYCLYRDRIHFRIDDEPGVVVEGVSLPDGGPKLDPAFGQVAVYRHPVDALIHISRPDAGPLHLHASYQGCNEPRGVCYRPNEKTLTVAIEASAPAEPVPFSAEDP